MAPPKTPKDIVDKINADVNEALRQPALQDQFKKLSAVTFGGPVDKTSEYMREEVDRWAAVIKVGQYRAAVGRGPIDDQHLRHVRCMQCSGCGEIK